MAVKPIPEGHHTITPHLYIKNAPEAIEFYKKAFGAKEISRAPGPDGKIMHAELKIGDSFIYLAEEAPEWGACAPGSQGSPVSIHLYVPDVDKAFERAVAAGATAPMPLMNMFWGDRYGKLIDPFGHSWSMATHIEDVSPEDMQVRMVKAMAEMGKG
jgi:uncharacterized glyoxalase superfamily protein PhnB